MRTVFWLCFLSAVLPGCCVPISTAKPLTTRNVENASALRQNLASFVAATNSFFHAAVASEAIRQRNAIIQSVLAEIGNDQAEFNTRAKALQDALNNFPSGDLHEAKKVLLRSEKPITAAVAFDKLTSEGAASIAAQLKAVKEANLTHEESFAIFVDRLSFLLPMRDIDMAEADVKESYDSLVSALLITSDNNLLIAQSLAKATSADVASSSFTRDLIGGDDLTALIAESVLARTKNPRRADAAKKIIKTIVKEQ